MRIWDHLFLDGEFMRRERLLSGLTLEQVALRPAGASHSIFDELWHATDYQRSILERRPADDGDELFPGEAPASEREWLDLVNAFLTGAAQAATQTPEQLGLEVAPGVTMADELRSVAVHNAYHLGKIVALRQMMGAWPPDSL